MNVIFIVAMLVILSSIGLAMYWMHRQCAATKVEKMSNAAAAAAASAAASSASCTSSKNRVVFFSMEGCPHCDNFQEDWDAFSKVVKASGWVPEKHVYYRKETADKVNDACVAQYVTSSNPIVSSFPTVVFITSDGAADIYNGSRSVDNLSAELHRRAK